MDKRYGVGKLDLINPNLNGKNSSYSGEIVSIRFHNENNGYSVFRFRPEGDDNTINCVGITGEINPGDWVCCSGIWENDSRFGLQLRIETLMLSEPASIEGTIRFLGSGLVNGIGISTAEKIVNYFGSTTLSVIENSPERLMEIDGIGKKKYKIISESFNKRKKMASTMVWLQSLGVGVGTSMKIYQEYQDTTKDKVTENPYRLADEIWGIGFHTADRIALKMGFKPDSPFRLEAAAMYILRESESAGHIFLNMEDFRELCRNYTDIQDLNFSAIVNSLTAKELVIVQGEMIYQKRLHYCETQLAKKLKKLKETTGGVIHKKPDEIYRIMFEHQNIELDVLQIEAVRNALKGGITIITGGPGTGKTTLVKAICENVINDGFSIELAAPTGRAAKRLSQATGLEARTIHRLLDYQPGKNFWGKNEKNPLDANFIVIDEVSMVDLPLMYHLSMALTDKTSLILVGDKDQLPSVGPGSVLEDLIRSGIFNVITLSTIYRQAMESNIVQSAHNINTGMEIISGKGNNGDLFFINKEDPNDVLKIIIQLVSERIPDSYGLSPFTDIQVLSPMHKGVLGTENLNTELQKALNKSPDFITRGDKKYIKGDRIIQLRNNYDLGIFNGDIGTISEINDDDNSLTVDFDEKSVQIPEKKLSEMSLAYAVSIHKSQGSEYGAVVMPIHTQHAVMLQRNLIYTAVTRARKLVVMVGTQKAMGMAISNYLKKHRNTFLYERLTGQS
ncbi:MAG: ATP-dependent RecD-like DNA helicase [Deltaproteobacteria bacterium]|nr:ATP-dependent RecD-like DNA helicase [Deltaproteobacteria bacterium]